MGRRAIWSGAITFGMVNIPVKLFSATTARDLSFNLVHATCGTRVQQKRWCPTEDVEVPWEEIVRGYEYAKGQFVTLTDEDFEQLPLPSRHTIDITAFVESEEIDPVFYEKSYYLEPDARNEKAYALLLRALEERNLTGIATITMRKKEQLCSLRSHGGTLMLETLYYPDEVQLEREVDLGKVKIDNRELEMAFALIDLLKKPFEPGEYRDHYREALAELIDAKLEGKEVVTSPPPRDTKVIDLADALARSVAAARKSGGARPKRRREAPARRTRKSPTRKAG
jgi:DNA end-binding protein Ku